MKKLIIATLLLGTIFRSLGQGIADFDYFCWALNHDTNNPARAINTNVFTVTDGAAGENRSAWFEHSLFVGAFQAAFTYQDVGGGGAEGMAFVIQNDPNGTNALGFDGEGLGYCGITPSVALLLNLSSNAPGGPSGWMLATNGIGALDLSGDPSELAYQSTAPLDLTAGNPVNVSISYDGATLYLSLTDLVSTASFQTNIAIDIPTLVGSNTAWVGLTGSDGTATSTQTVSNFTFVPLPTMTNASTDGTNLTVTWPGSILGYSLQSTTNLAAPSWQADPSPVIQTNGFNQAVIPQSAGQNFYRLVTARQSSVGALTAKGNIALKGSNIIDSYNSQDPNYSSNGLYTPTKRRDHARVLTDSTNVGAISLGTGKIYGIAVTGPGGTVTAQNFGAVGDVAWIAGNHAGWESGHVQNDANLQINDVVLPNTTGWSSSYHAGNFDGTIYDAIFTSGNYYLSSLSPTTMAVSGKVTIYVSGNFFLGTHGLIYIAPGASLTIYAGNIAAFGSSSSVNAAGSPSNCTIYGLPTCGSVEFNGLTWCGTLYAPEAALSISGGVSASGSFTANSILFTAGASMHFDESLSPPSYGW